MKSVLKFLLFIFPIFAVIIGVNITVDPANVVHGNIATKLVDHLLKGENIHLTSSNFDESIMREYLITQSNTIGTVAVGPSLVRNITSDMVSDEDFYNMAITSATGYDMMAVIGQMMQEDKLPKNIIMCMDTRFFDRKIIDGDDRWTSKAEYLNYLCKEIGVDQRFKGNGFFDKISKYKELFSPAYFQSSVKMLANGGGVEGQQLETVNADYSDGYWRPDGSFIIKENLKSYTKDQFEQYIKDTMDLAITPNTNMDKKQKVIFEKLIQYFHEKDINVKLFRCPFPPYLWDYIQKSNKYPIVNETNAFAEELADQYGCELIGVYNPKTVNCDNRDFYDYRHLRPEFLASGVFDFTFNY